MRCGKDTLFCVSKNIVIIYGAQLQITSFKNVDNTFPHQIWGCCLNRNELRLGGKEMEHFKRQYHLHCHVHYN
ncbi:hypothetical protein NQ315_010088, partial [Exocentrus adspersus]